MGLSDHELRVLAELERELRTSSRRVGGVRRTIARWWGAAVVALFSVAVVVPCLSSGRWLEVGAVLLLVAVVALAADGVRAVKDLVRD